LAEKTAIGFHEKFKQYDLGEGHPFRGDRFSTAMNFFRRQGLLADPRIVMIEPDSASRFDLLRVHDEEYVDLIFQLATENKAYDFETPVSPEILEAALLICGNAIACGKVVMENRARNAVAVGGGYHHAGKNHGGGFCLFNDIAVLIEYLRSEYNMRRFLVLDHDLHFGNGTSEIYYEDPTVLYISLHQDPRTIYPGTGFEWQIGKGNGEGYNVNVPLPPKTGDETYLYALDEVFVPLANEFKPEIIITNGGSDPHFADMLGNLGLTVNGFFQLAQTIRRTAQVCQGKLVLMPGSGYDPTVLPLCWYALTAGIVGIKEVKVKDPYSVPKEPAENRGVVEKTLDELKRRLRKHWISFDGYSYSGAQISDNQPHALQG
jgi:acetoin utilization protein AcuC